MFFIEQQKISLKFLRIQNEKNSNADLKNIIENSPFPLGNQIISKYTVWVTL
jgi:hypothetical protein